MENLLPNNKSMKCNISCNSFFSDYNLTIFKRYFITFSVNLMISFHHSLIELYNMKPSHPMICHYGLGHWRLEDKELSSSVLFGDSLKCKPIILFYLSLPVNLLKNMKE